MNGVTAQARGASDLASAGPPFTGPLFLVGMPRSGTKLLRELLNQHPQIGIPDAETEFLPWLAHKAGRFGDLSHRPAFDRLFQHLVRQSFFTYRAQAGRLVTAQDWYSACRRFDAAGLFEALVRLDIDAAHAGARIWGDKSPSYIDDLPLIDKLYPNARVVHIVRDVRDYCISMNDAWGKDMRRAAQRWADGVTGARRDGAALGSRYLEMRYEDLLRSPAAVLPRICDFLDIEFEPRMLTLARPSENLGRARGAQHVVADNQGKYASRMTPDMIRVVESLAGQAMVGFGYTLASPAQTPKRLSMLQSGLAQLRDGLELVKHREGGRGVFSALVFHLRYFVTTRG